MKHNDIIYQSTSIQVYMRKHVRFPEIFTTVWCSTYKEARIDLPSDLITCPWNCANKKCAPKSRLQDLIEHH